MHRYVFAGLLLLVPMMGYAQTTATTSGQYVNANRSNSNSVVILQSNDGVTSQPINASSPLPATDANNAPFQGEVAMSLGVTYAAARSLKAVCTTAGAMSVTYINGSTGTWPVVIGTQTLPIAVTMVNNTGTTATCSYFNLQ